MVVLLLGCVCLVDLHVVHGSGSFIVVEGRVVGVVAGWLQVVCFFTEFVQDGVCDFFSGVALSEEAKAGCSRLG